ALAMILGMLPMALGLGEGGEQNAPLGRAVIGGLLAATVFTLFVVPCAYTALRKHPPVKHMLDRKIAEEYEKGGPEHAEAHPGATPTSRACRAATSIRTPFASSSSRASFFSS